MTPSPSPRTGLRNPRFFSFRSRVQDLSRTPQEAKDPSSSACREFFSCQNTKATEMYSTSFFPLFSLNQVGVFPFFRLPTSPGNFQRLPLGSKAVPPFSLFARRAMIQCTLPSRLLCSLLPHIMKSGIPLFPLCLALNDVNITLISPPP